MIRVRRLRADEGAGLREMRLRALRDSPEAFSSTLERELQYAPELWSTRAKDASAGNKAGTFVACEGAGEGDKTWCGLVTVLGLGHEAVGEGDAVELVSMWIAPERRREGIGKLLVRAALDFARASGAAAVELSVIRGNTDGLALYLGQGFAVIAADALPSGHACKKETRLRLVL